MGVKGGVGGKDMAAGHLFAALGGVKPAEEDVPLPDGIGGPLGHGAVAAGLRLGGSGSALIVEVEGNLISPGALGDGVLNVVLSAEVHAGHPEAQNVAGLEGGDEPALEGMSEDAAGLGPEVEGFHNLEIRLRRLLRLLDQQGAEVVGGVFDQVLEVHADLLGAGRSADCGFLTRREGRPRQGEAEKDAQQERGDTFCHLSSPYPFIPYSRSLKAGSTRMASAVTGVPSSLSVTSPTTAAMLSISLSGALTRALTVLSSISSATGPTAM